MLVLFPATLFSQAKFSGAVFLGPVTSQISGDGLGGWDKFGFAAGAEVRMGFNPKSAITLGIQYINKGSAKPADVNNGDYEQLFYKLNYVDVPVMYNFSRKQWQFSAGLYTGVLLNQKLTYNGNDYQAGEGQLRPPFEDLDLGAIGGIAYALNDKWQAELRAESSIIPTRPSPNPVNKWSYYEQGNYNQLMQLIVRYRLGKMD